MAQEETQKEKSLLETAAHLESEVLEDIAEEKTEQPETTLEAAVFKVWGEEQDAEDSVTDEETDSEEKEEEVTEEEDDGIEGSKKPDEGPSDATEVEEEEKEDDAEEAYHMNADDEDPSDDDSEDDDVDDVEVSADDAEEDMEDEVEDEVVGDDDSDEEESDVEDEAEEAVETEEAGDSEEEDGIDGAADPDTDVSKAVDSIAQTVIKAATHKAKEKLNATYGGMKEDLDALCAEDDSLSEEFKTKAATIFEAAVTSKVNEHIEEIQESYIDYVNEEVNSLNEGLIDKIDSYLTYVAEQWIEKNDVAVTNVLRTEIAEAFMASLKENFVEHYIEMPEGKTDMFDEISQQNADLSEDIATKDETISQLAEEIIALKKEKVISDLSEGLADTQVGKFKKLTADVVFEDVDSFSEKVKVIRESYFNKKSEKVEETLTEKSNTESTKEVVVTEEVEEANDGLSPLMSQYVKAFTKLDKEAF